MGEQERLLNMATDYVSEVCERAAEMHVGASNCFTLDNFRTAWEWGGITICTLTDVQIDRILTGRSDVKFICGPSVYRLTQSRVVTVPPAYCGLDVYDVLLIESHSGPLAFQVTGVYLGGLDSMSMIGIKSLGEPFHNNLPPSSKECRDEVLIPEPILLALIKGGQSHFRPVKEQP